MMRKCLFFFLMATIMPLVSYAQRTAKVVGEWEVKISDDTEVTFYEAKKRCIELAKNNAIKQEFGEWIGHTIDIVDYSKDGKSSNSSYEERIVVRGKGEWLEDVRAPELEMKYIDGTIFLKARVWGNAREVVSNNVMLKWMIQHDDNGIRKATTILQNRERFFVNFISPIDGYVAIYLMEDNGNGSCLLPYRRSNVRSYKVKGGKDYTFFDKEMDLDPLVDRLVLSTKKSRERFTIWLVFSPNEFTKCLDKAVDSKHPNAVSIKEFREWKLQNQLIDHNMQFESRTVIVVKPDAEN